MSIEAEKIENLPSRDTTTGECSLIRHRFYNGKPAGLIADEIDKTTKTVRYHLKGECDCKSWVRPIDYSAYRGDRFGCSLCDDRQPSLRSLQNHIQEGHNGD